MKFHYDDLLEALRDAELPLSVLVGQHQREGFGSDELCSVDIQILYTIQNELEHMIYRIREKREVKGWTQ
jgi:hypothetical protein